MNKQFAIGILLLALIAAGVGSYLYQAQNQQDSLPDAESSPLDTPPVSAPTAATETPIDFTLSDLEGTQRQLSDWSGKARLVNFWATWCAPCRREIPLLKKAQDDFAEDNLQVIGIAVDFKEDVISYAEETDFNYPILVGQEDAMAAAEASGIPFIGLPFTIVVAPGGELLTTHTGEILETHIEQILAVFEELEAGDTDLAGARKALRTL